MRAPLFKTGPSGEPRDKFGRWVAAMRAKGAKVHDTSGTTGLNREQVLDKVKRILDDATGHQGIGSRTARYAGALIGAAASAVPGTPPETFSHATTHGAELADQLAAQTGVIIGKVREHPAFKKLTTRIILREKHKINKMLDPLEADQLKNIIAGVMADTRLDPQVSCSDSGLAVVASGAYRHLYDRICALRDAAG